MLYQQQTDYLLESIRTGREMSRSEKLRLIVFMSMPSVLAQISTVMMFFIDASMVGHLGARASASIGLVESTTWLMGSVMGAASMGFSVQVAHFVGANDMVRARQVFRHALICGLAFSFLVSAVGVAVHGGLPGWLGGGADIAADASAYFLIYSLTLPVILLFQLSSAMQKSAGDMRLPSIMSVTVCMLDVLFNYLFIYLLDWGVVGAACGTSLAYVCATVPNLWQSTCHNKILRLSQDKVRFEWVWDYVRHALRIGLPIAVQSVLMSGAQIVSTMIVAPLGNVAIASHSFAITAESLCYMPGYGIGSAASTLVGQTHGAGRLPLCKSFAHMAIALGMAVMTLMGVVLYVFAPEMIGMLSPVDAIRQLGASCLRIEAFAEPFFAASIVSYSICVGAGDTLRPTCINLATMWLVRLTLAYALSQHYGLQGVWIAMAVELTLRGCLMLGRIGSGAWLKSFKMK